jgi:hypothetical protein
VVICVGGEVAEVLADPARCEAINRHGMVFGLGGVRQATSRRFRRALQTAEKVHLCRVAGCTEGDMIHVGSFGVLAGTDEIDVHEVMDRGAWSWACGSCAVALLDILVYKPTHLLRAALAACCCCGRRGRRPSEWSRSADSESETDDGEDRCQAHHLRWEDTKGLTQLASSPCRGLDVQSQPGLTGDAKALNDVDMASLCPTHRALYLTLRWNHKCPVADCCRAAATKVGRLRLCSLHADEERLGGRKDAVAPRPPSPRTTHDALDRLDLGGGGAAGLRKRRTSKSPVTALSPKAVKAPQTRNLDALLAQLPAEPAAHEDADPPPLLRQYLEMRATGLDDAGAQAAVAMDRDLSDA